MSEKGNTREIEDLIEIIHRLERRVGDLEREVSRLLAQANKPVKQAAPLSTEPMRGTFAKSLGQITPTLGGTRLD